MMETGVLLKIRSDESKGTLITSGGSGNIPVPAGTYNIYFNDITGAYAFVEVK